MTGRLRVLMLLDSLGGGGSERSTIELMSLLAERGVDVHLVALADIGSQRRQWADAQGITADVIGSRRVLVATKRLREIISATKPDLVHTALFASDTVGRLAAIGTNVPVVCTIVTTPYSHARRRNPDLRPWKLSVIKQFERVMSRAVSRYQAVSEGAAQHVARELGVKRSKITVAERGRRSERFEAIETSERQRLREQAGAGDSDVLVLAVGRIEYPKAFDTLAAAMALLPDRFRLAIAGVQRPGRAADALEQAISEAKVADRVRLLGERNDVPQLMKSADLLCVSSRYEGTSGVTLEAMAAGLPIVATKAEGLIGIVEDQRTALLAEIDDPQDLARAIAQVADDDQLRMALATNGIAEFAERFTAESAADRLAALYRSVSESGR